MESANKLVAQFWAEQPVQLLARNLAEAAGQILGVGIGAITGALIGNKIGSHMDDQDRTKMEKTANHSLENTPSGQTSSWNNPDSGNGGSFTPTKTYQQNGQYCRDFTHQIKVDGKTQEGYGTACRQPDGSWKTQ